MQGKQRLLICDGHDSHISRNFIAHCIENQITFLILPLHTSHLLQLADVGVFRLLAVYHRQETDHLTSDEVRQISEAE